MTFTGKLGRMWPVLLAVVCFMWPLARAADPVLTPVNVTDTYGNFADLNSTIAFASLPSGLAYKTSTTYNDGGLGPLFAFARSFINTIMPGAFPYDLVKGLINGSFDIGADYMTIVNYAVGFAVCVVLGFLFLIIMPIVGCCFCCCRTCCGMCGGDMKTKRKDTDNCYRIVYSIILAIGSVFVFVGCMCVYVTNGQVATSITALQTTLVTNLDDLELFLNNTVTQITYLTTDDFNFTAKVISRDLDNIGYLVGVPVRDTLSTEGGVNAAMDAIIALDANITAAGAMLLAINSTTASLKTNATQLSTELASAKQDVDDGKVLCSTALCDALNSDLIAMDVDFNSLPDISSNVALMETVLSKNLTAMALDGKTQFDEIPQKVTTDTASVITQIKDLLTSFSSTIAGVVSSISSLPSGVGTQLVSTKASLESYRSTITPYDNYRSYGGIALACLVLLVVVLQVLGLVFGFCGYDNNKEAHERSGLSHVGGQLLMAASGFIFIFSALLMLLTVIFFLVGGLMEKVMCQPLADPSYTIFKELLDGPGGLFNNYFLGQMLLQNGTINLTFSGVLEGCKSNGGAFSVLKLNSLFDLSTVTNYKSSIDIQSQIDAINVDLSTVDLMSTSTEQQLRDFSDAVSIDFAGFVTVLSNSTTKADLAALASNLTTVASDPSTPSAAATKFNSAASKLTATNSGIYQSVNNGQAQLLTDINTMQAYVANVPTGVNATIDAANAVETYLGLNGTALIKTVASTYGNRILASADAFATSALSKVQNDVAGCLPVYNVYQSVIVIGVCKYIVDVLNGFWFSMGWIIFFETICLIFDIKLAKYLRRMKEPDDDDSNGTEMKSSKEKI